MREVFILVCLLVPCLCQFPGHEQNVTIDCLDDDAYTCLDGTCIREEFHCDGEKHCSDGDDESFCELDREEPTARSDEASGRCNDTLHFTCLDSNYCIPLEWRCNGEEECMDGSDEKDCVKSCKGFECGNGTCISSLWTCDGKVDCDDKSDEKNCRGKMIAGLPVDHFLCSADNDFFKCSDSSFCIISQRVCDNITDCRNGYDEGPYCDKWHTMCDNVTNCSHGCVPTPEGPYCRCPNGYTHTTNNTCRDVDECTETVGPCAQFCHNNVGGFTCSCDENYYYLLDGIYDCKVKGNDPAYLFYSLHNEIRAINLKTRKRTIVTKSTKQAVGVAYDGFNVYWTEIHQGHEAIMRAEFENIKETTEVLSILGVETPEDIAIDWLTSNFYYTDSHQQHIVVCTSDGKICAPLPAAEMHKPRAVVLNALKGQMYWSDWGDKPQIVRANMDGSEAVPFVKDQLVWPNGLCLDTAGDRLYWVDGHAGGIESIRLDGSSRHEVLQDKIHHPYWLAIFESTLYWSDWATHSLQMCDKFTGKKRQVVDRGLIYGVHVYHPALTPKKEQHACNHQLCSDICLLNGPDGYSCICPLDKKMSDDKHTCHEATRPLYLLVSGGTLLLRLQYKPLGRLEQTPVNLKLGRIDAQAQDPNKGIIYLYDGMRKSIVYVSMEEFTRGDYSVLLNQNIEKIEDMDFDFASNNLYWIDSTRRTIEVFSTKNNHRTILYTFPGNEVPLSMCLLPEYGTLLVAIQLNRDDIHIDSINMDGTGRKHVFEHGFQGPHIRIRYHSDMDILYISDSGNALIETAHPGGTARETFRQLFTSVTSMAPLGSDLFWTDRKTPRLFWSSIHTTGGTSKRLELDIFVKNTQLHVMPLSPVPSSNLYMMKHPCASAITPCSHICVQTEHRPEHIQQNRTIVMGYKCLCPLGMIEKNNTCVERVKCPAGGLYCHKSNICLDFSRKCDGKVDCPEGEDEEGCIDPISHQCKLQEFQCKNGECIEQARRCDLHKDCMDGSDELDCHTEIKSKCSSSQFSCDNTTICIDEVDVCDGYEDCPSGQDEDAVLCDSKLCSKDEFQCLKGNCIPKQWECDGDVDCSDASDEHVHCPSNAECSADMFRCADSTCVALTLRCDAHADCADASDEAGCLDIVDPTDDQCKGKEYICPSDKKICLPLSARCNGRADCPGGADEVGCETRCSQDEFQCDGHRCISSHLLCDGFMDCRDESDESKQACQLGNATNINRHYPIPMSCEGGYTCDSGECVDYSEVCDGINNCLDSTDEHGNCATACNHHHCSNTCKATPKGSVCLCPPGYTLSSDSRTCEDVNECTRKPCSHMCTNTQGSFICTCYSGYVPRSDKRTCKAKGEALKIFYLAGHTIRTASKTGSIGVVFEDPTVTTINSFDVNVRKNILYFSSEELGKLFVVNLSTRERIAITNIGKPTKVAVDWVTGNVYFVDNSMGSKCIRVCDDTRMRCARLQKLPDDVEVTALSIDPFNKFMFYCAQTKQGASVKIASLYGRRIEELLSVHRCTSLAADSHSKTLYIGETEPSQISSINYEGNLPQKFITANPFIMHPASLTLFEDHMYLLTSGGVKLVKCVLHGDKTCVPVNYNVGNAQSMALFQESVQRDDVNNLCEKSNCDGVCGPAELGARCVCVDGTLQHEDDACVNAPQDMMPLFNGQTAKSHSRSKRVTTIVVLFVVVTLLLLLATPLLYHHWNKIKARRAGQMPVHFQNPLYNQEQMSSEQAEPSVTIQPTTSSRGWRMTVNPVEQYVRNAWRSVNQRVTGRRPIGTSQLEVPVMDVDSDVESDREHQDSAAGDQDKLVFKK